MRPDEAQLNDALDRYAGGEPAAFEVLYGLLYRRLHSYFTRMRGSERFVDDLMQETFLRIHRARGLFARGAPALPWVYTLARNVLIDHTRSAKASRTAHTVSSDDAPEVSDAGADVESSAVAAETARTIERVLSRLPATQREAFMLVRYEGLSLQDAANVLGATVSAIKLRVFRAYEAIRAELAVVEGAGPRKGGEETKPIEGSDVATEEAPMRARLR